MMVRVLIEIRRMTTLLVVAAVSSCALTTDPHPRKQNRIYLLSLQYPTDQRFSKHVKDVWRWKDAVLGDGRDFFVPRPQTLQALQRRIVSEETMLQECAILSNCARFELLLVVVEASASLLPLENISRLLLCQVAAYQQRKFQPPLDWPGSIVSYDDDSSQVSSAAVRDLVDFWTVVDGPTDVLQHLCRVAAGMAARPARPGRVTEFRPFSSRDAHVLLQLKRTVAIAPGSTTKLLLQTALRAGKAVRNPEATPAILPLRSSSTNASLIATTVQTTTIDPLVQATVRAWYYEVPTDAIVQLRTAAMALSRTPFEATLVRSLLHAPTMELRNGTMVNQTLVLEHIANTVEAHRVKVGS